MGVTGDEACAGGTGEEPGASIGAEAPADRPGAADSRA
jgi:hypothetical protein